MDLTASTTARDIRCWTNGILCPRLDLSGMETSRVERAHPAGLSHAFLPRPGRQAPLGNRPLCHENRLGSASCHETCLRTQSHVAKTRPTRTGLGWLRHRDILGWTQWQGSVSKSEALSQNNFPRISRPLCLCERGVCALTTPRLTVPGHRSQPECGEFLESVRLVAIINY